ncbi:type II toxin-antitoxin system PrlF family antitoxin [Pseudomonas knackmussii]|uniref:type II toxin-antitoxin system PrlF family antitoxin n=1 Tax=Pseudomonas knackmussii TaxID=65741 RepID=UPI0006944387|nr:type II toxin-antitoxin system PrlF family antitoxin [Pseudomonas knackmussii]
MTRVGIPEADPVLEQFLDFLEVDITTHPERLQAVDTELRTRAQSLVGGINVDLDLPLAEGDE